MSFLLGKRHLHPQSLEKWLPTLLSFQEKILKLLFLLQYPLPLLFQKLTLIFYSKEKYNIKINVIIYTF